MAKRLTDQQIEETIKSFSKGKTVDELSQEYKFSKLTISRNLRKKLGEEVYKELKKKNQLLKKTKYKSKSSENNMNNCSTNEGLDLNSAQKYDSLQDFEKDFFSPTFIEIAPLDCEINNSTQKDLSSVPISEVEFPKNVYMIVNKNIELETKLLKDFPEWHFLPEDDLERKTLKIYDDSKTARNDCHKEQKVLKVPNPEVFKIVASILISRGISRIVSSDKLIAL